MSLEFELLFSSVVVTVLGAGATTGAGCTTTVSCGAGGTYAAVVLVTSSVFELHPLMKGTAARVSTEIAIVADFFIGSSSWTRGN
jgi:uncharacterized protein (UPF0333 family)